MKKVGFLLLCFLLSIGIFAQNRHVDLTILQTSDVHGAFFPYDFINAKPMQGSLARVSSIVKEKRAESKNVILLDNGDILQGQPTVYYYNFIDTATKHLYLRVVDFMRYDAVGVGNHDIEAGHPVYDRVASQSSVPILAANIVRKSDGKPYFKPYAIIERDGVKVAVLGLITPAIPKWLPESIWSGMEFEDMVESARKWMTIIQEKENPHLIVGLFHAGHDFTYQGETEATYKNENASLLVAQQVPGFDAVLIGHDHDYLVKKVTNANSDTVLLLDPTSSARYVSEVAVTVELNEKGELVSKKVDGKLIDAAKVEVDEAFMQKFAADYDKVEAFVSRQVGTFTKSVSSREAFFGASDFIDLIHRIQLAITKADISFTAPLSLDIKIDKGPVYVSDMFKLYRYENLLYTMTLTGKEVQDFLEYSYSLWVNHMTDADDHLLLLKQDGNERNGKLENSFYNFDSAAGILYTVDVSKPTGSRVHIISMADGSLFKHDKTYRVAINSYRGNGGGGHLTEGAGIPASDLSKRVVASTDKDLRYYLMQWIEQQGTVTPQLINGKASWEFLPREWVKPASKRDYELLFKSKMKDE